MAVEKIENRQLIFMIFLIRASLALSFLPVVSTGTAGRDAWLSVIIVFIVTVIMTLIIVGLATKFPRESIVTYAEKLLGNKLGKLIAFLVLWLFLHLAATDVRIYAELINIAFLPRTPLIIIIGGMVFLAAATSYLGIEVLGRMADFIFLWYIVLVGASILLPIPEILPDQFQPIMAQGVTPILGSALTSSALAVQLLAVTIILPHVNEPEKGVRSILVSVSMASILIMLLTVLVVGLVGPEMAKQAKFPFLFTLRNVNGSEILERLEILSVLAWGLGTYITLSVYLYCGAKGVSQLFNVESYRPLVGPMAVTWIALSIHSFDNIYQVDEFFSPEIFFPYMMSIFVIIYGLLWGAYFIRVKTGKGIGSNKNKIYSNKDERQ